MRDEYFDEEEETGDESDASDDSMELTQSELESLFEGSDVETGSDTEGEEETE